MKDITHIEPKKPHHRAGGTLANSRLCAERYMQRNIMRNLLLFIIFTYSIPALSQEHPCGESEVNIVKTGEWESTRYQVLVHLNERKTELWLSSVDFVTSRCIVDSKNSSKILIRSYCGGSGCSEDTYIIINARTLMVELVPVMRRSNRLQAEEILGKPIENENI